MTAAYLIKTIIPNRRTGRLTLSWQKTMYGGNRIAPGDTAYIFDSEEKSGNGLFARSTVIDAKHEPPPPGIPSRPPSANVRLRLNARPLRPLGRADLKPFTAWNDGHPQTELNFKFYRQATNKIGGISAAAAAFLDTFFTA